MAQWPAPLSASVLLLLLLATARLVSSLAKQVQYR
jgi:hypothetical protein